MADQAAMRDRELGRALERIPVPPLSRNLASRATSAAKVSVRSTARPRPSRRRGRTARVAILIAALAAAVAAATGIVGGSLTHAPEHANASTQVRTLHAFTHRVNARRIAQLPPNVVETIDQLGADATTAQEPIIGSPSVYLAQRGSSALCMILEFQSHNTGACYQTLRRAAGSVVRPNISIVAGQVFISGLVGDDVRSISASVSARSVAPGTPLLTARIENNVFIVALPQNRGGTGAATLIVTRSDGSTDTVQTHVFPPIPPGAQK
jgi:hypothetical protein